MRVLLIGEADAGWQHLGRELMLDGCEVCFADDGTSALSLAHAHRPEVVVLNRWVPDAAGVWLCGALRTAGGRAPIMILTSGGGPKECVEALEAGADDCLTAPYNVRELKARLRALHRRRLR